MNTSKSTERPIELRAPDVEEVLSRPPSWLVRCGSGLMGLLVAGLLVGTYLIRFPEYVEATAVVTTRQPPVWLLARSGTRIQVLRHGHLDRVSKGAVLAILENPADAGEVFQLKAHVMDSSLFEPDSLQPDRPPFNKTWRLGILQAPWSIVVNRFMEYYVSLRLDDHAGKVLALQREINLQTVNLNGLTRQLTQQTRQCTLLEERLGKDRHLLTLGLTSEETVHQSERTWLESLQTLESLRQGINNLSADQVLLRRQLKETEVLHRQVLMAKRQAYLMAVNEWRVALDNWESTYVVTSPADGILTYPCARNLHQPVAVGERLCAVVPYRAGPPIVRLQYGAEGHGKVRNGQAVRIFLDGYPYLEYGTLGAVVSQTTLMPDEQARYTATAVLPDGLNTNYATRIGLNGELMGHARILVNNLRLIQQMVAPLKYLVVGQSQHSSTASIMVGDPPLYNTPAPPRGRLSGRTVCNETND